MKGNANIIIGSKQVEINLTLEQPEDAGAAMEIIRCAAHAVWPTIVFNDESDSSDQRHESWLEKAPEAVAGAESPTQPTARGKRDYSRPPKEGSLGEKVLEACRRLQTTDFTVIVDALDLKSNTTACLIAGLKRGGHISDGALQ